MKLLAFEHDNCLVFTPSTVVITSKMTSVGVGFILNKYTLLRETIRSITHSSAQRLITSNNLWGGEKGVVKMKGPGGN